MFLLYIQPLTCTCMAIDLHHFLKTKYRSKIKCVLFDNTRAFMVVFLTDSEVFASNKRLTSLVSVVCLDEFFLVTKSISTVLAVSEQQPPRVAAGRLGERQTDHRHHHPRGSIAGDPDGCDGVFSHLQSGRTLLEQRVGENLSNSSG